MAALGHLCADPANAAPFAEAGAVPALLKQQKSKSCERDHDMQEMATFALAGLASLVATHSLMINDGAIPRVIKLLKSDHVGVRDAAVCFLSRFPEQAREMVSAGVVEPMAACLGESNPGRTRVLALRTLDTLASSCDVAPNFLKCGVVRRVLDIVNSGQTADSDLLTAALSMLIVVTTRHPECRPVVEKARIGRRLVEILTAASTPDLFEGALRTLGNVSNFPSNTVSIG